jgi:hypothetical protein
MIRRTLIAASLLAAFSCLGWAQTPNPEPKYAEPPLPIVSFDFVLNGGTPPHYSIAVEPHGKATYRADEVPAADHIASQPYMTQFVVSEPTRARIFELTRALDCFKGQYDYRGGQRIANMGAKTLKCTFADRETITEFNYTTNPRLQELTSIFQNMANTLEYGRRLEYLHRYDKLGLEAELKSMEDAANKKQLAELQAVEPTLQRLLNDSGIINVTRRRAEHLLQIIKSDPAARAAAPE